MAAASPSRTALGPRLVRGFARGLLDVFYRRVEVIGAGYVPAHGPLIVAANHQNALVDPMLLLASIPRSLVPLAKAPLFRHPIIGPFLKLAGAIPVTRRQDAGGGPAGNEAMFESATATLARGGGILIFPEGVSQPEPALMPLRTGAARMLLGAPREVAAATALLPVGLVFHDPERFRAGWALVLVGRPVETADCLRLHETEPEEAVRRLTERLAEDLRRLIVEVGDRQTLRLVEEAEAIWLAESPESARDAAARAEWRRRAAAAYRYLLPREPARVGALRGELERYVKDLEDARMGEPHLSASFPPRVVLRYALVQGAALVLGLPLALWGIASHALPYWLTALVIRLARPEADVEATYKLAAGLFLYPLAWITEGWLAMRVGGAWLLALFAALLAPSAFFALGWSERLGKVARDTRAWLAFLGDRDIHRHLAGRRRAIMRELARARRAHSPLRALRCPGAPGMNRRAIVAWALYDFANSSFAAVIFATIYAAYYALAVVGNDKGDGDLWWGRVVSTSMAIVAVTSPFLGGIADRAGVRRPLFIGFTALAVTSTALMTTVEPGMIVWGFVLGVLGNVGYESALVYYNAYLPALAPQAYHGRVSGWGFAVGYAGSIVALLIAFPFVEAKAYAGAFLTTAALYATFSLPAFILLPRAPRGRMPLAAAARVGAAEVIATARKILRLPDLRRFLGAYLIYEDGVNTVVAFSAIFAAQTLGFPMSRLILLYIVVQVSALIGALCWAWPTDRLGPKRVVMITLCQWTAVVVAAWFVETQGQFWVLAVVAGTGLGAVQAASRAFLTSLIPPGMEAELFGFYSFCGKSAAVIGPLVFGGISHATGGDQRAGILAIGAFFLVGFALVARVRAGGPTDRPANATRAAR